MATTDELVADGRLVILQALEGDRRPWRQLLALPRFVKWLDKKLPEIGDAFSDSTPLEQVGALFEAFALGRPLIYTRQFREIYPTRFGVWELKTPAVRIFGWFGAKDCFIAAFGDSADHIKQHDLVHGFLNQTVYQRSILRLNQPEYVSGVSYHDVLSNAADR